MKKITARVTRGTKVGLTLTPHWYQEGHYLVSKGGNTTDCATKVFHEAKLEDWIQRGYSLRMSAPGVSPSLFAHKSLTIENLEMALR